jgi:ribosomal protein S18 acetylase RimI-like enzyme
LTNEVIIEPLQSVEEAVNELSELLIQVVEEGASLGFLPPLSPNDAVEYWEGVMNPGVILLIAKFNDRIAGTVQLHLCAKQNGTHRAEIAKLMTHPQYRRNGIARKLMQKAEQIAQQNARTLIILDTKNGDPSNQLYQTMGYTLGGQIPEYAKTASGELAATNIYFKTL